MSTWGLQLLSLKRTILWGGQGSKFMPIESTDHLFTANPVSMWLDWGCRWGGSVEKFYDISSVSNPGLGSQKTQTIGWA